MCTALDTVRMVIIILASHLESFDQLNLVFDKKSRSYHNSVAGIS